MIGIVILLSIRLQTLMFFDGILVLSLLAFAGTVAVVAGNAAGSFAR